MSEGQGLNRCKLSICIGYFALIKFRKLTETYLKNYTANSYHMLKRISFKILRVRENNKPH